MSLSIFFIDASTHYKQNIYKNIQLDIANFHQLCRKVLNEMLVLMTSSKVEKFSDKMRTNVL